MKKNMKKRMVLAFMIILLGLLTTLVTADAYYVPSGVPEDCIRVIQETGSGSDSNTFSERGQAAGGQDRYHDDYTVRYSVPRSTAGMTVLGAGDSRMYIFPTQELADMYKSQNPNAIVTTSAASGVPNPVVDGVANPDYGMITGNAWDKTLDWGDSDFANSLQGQFLTNAISEFYKIPKEEVHEFVSTHDCSDFIISTETGAPIMDTTTGEIYPVTNEWIDANPELYQQMDSERYWDERAGEWRTGFATSNVKRAQKALAKDVEKPGTQAGGLENMQISYVKEEIICDDCDDDDDDDDDNPGIPFIYLKFDIPKVPTEVNIEIPEWNPEMPSGGPTCTPPTVTPPVIPEPRPHRENSVTKADCNSNPTYISKEYEYETDSCGIVYETATTIIINYPSNPNVVPLLAGSTFNWGPISSNVTVKSGIYDTSVYQATVANNTANIESLDSYIGCLQSSIFAWKRLLNEGRKLKDEFLETCTKANEEAREQYELALAIYTINYANWAICEALSANSVDPNDCGPAPVPPDEPKYADCAGIAAEVYDQKLAEIESQIANLESMSNSAAASLSGINASFNETRQCEQKIMNFNANTFSSNNDVKIENAIMTLSNGYQQYSNTATGIKKNSGELVIENNNNGWPTIAIEKKPVEGTFERYARFTIPVNTSNGTTGTLQLITNSPVITTKEFRYSDDAQYPEWLSLVPDGVVYDDYQYSQAGYYGLWLMYIDNDATNYPFEKWYDELSKVGTTPKCETLFSCRVHLAELYKEYAETTNILTSAFDSAGVAVDVSKLSQYYKDNQSIIAKSLAELSKVKLAKPVEISEEDINKFNSQVLGGTVMTRSRNIVIPTDDTYVCDISIVNPYFCTSTCEDNNTGNINLVYRSISLSKPFPNATGASDMRIMGSNWSASVANSIITNNRGVKEDKVYSLEPLYTIKLTPTTIQKIQDYNDSTNYADFNLNCDSNGKYCTSSFLRNFLPSLNAISYDSSCAISLNGASDWFDCNVGITAED